MWMQHYLACENIIIQGIEVWDHGNRNNDAIDIDGCRNVVISNCIFDTDDDGITLKSTGPNISENITINNCVVSSHCNAIKMGTETTGGFRNITISNCVIKPSENKNVVYGKEDGLAGIALEIVDGGILELVTISNISIEAVSTPIFVKLGNRARKYREGVTKPNVGIMRNINISNITARGTSLATSSITGIPGYYVENISLSNIQIISSGGGTLNDASREVPENEQNYPESVMFGQSLPSCGLYVRHVKDITLHNVKFLTEQQDSRPSLLFDDVKGLDISSLRYDVPAQKEPVVRLIQVKDALIYGCRAVEGTNTYLKVEGDKTERISLLNNDLSCAGTTVETGKEVRKNTVKMQ